MFSAASKPNVAIIALRDICQSPVSGGDVNDERMVSQRFAEAQSQNSVQFERETWLNEFGVVGTIRFPASTSLSTASVVL
jgi:hypothetical protein